MYIIKKTEKGYSLVEVLIAVSILMLAIVGPLTIAAKSLQSAQYARQQTTAFFLAQEGITAVNTFRNWYALQAYIGSTDPWDWASPTASGNALLLRTLCFNASGSCGIDFRDGTLNNNIVACNAGLGSSDPCILKLRPPTTNTTVTALYSYSGGAGSAYTRSIKLTRQGTNEVLVNVEVKWNTKFLGGATQSVVLQTSLFNIYEDL